MMMAEGNRTAETSRASRISHNTQGNILKIYQALSPIFTEPCTFRMFCFPLRFIIQHKVFFSNLITGDKIFVWWRVKMLYWKAASSSNNATDLRLLSGHKEPLLSLLDHNRAAYQACVITCR